MWNMIYSTNNEECFVKSFGPFTITSSSTINQELSFKPNSEELNSTVEPKNCNEQDLQEDD